MKPRFFATPENFRAWLEENHANAPELLVGFHKKHTGKPSIDWLYWIISARKPEPRKARLAGVIVASAAAKKL